MTIQKIIDGGYIWEDTTGNWCRKCLKCNNIVISKSGKNYVAKSFEKGRACHHCKRMGYHHSPETIEKIISSQKVRPFTEKHKDKLSIASQKSHHPWRNSKRPEWFGEIISKKLAGRIISDEWKQKLRTAKLKRFEELGISACKDKNSDEFFDRLNKCGYDFIPKTFVKIGYVADGYDKEKHMWVEYDTPYHNKPKQKEKDLIRQNNIIKYFEDINNPLKSFMRVSVDKEGKILGYKHVCGEPIILE